MSAAPRVATSREVSGLARMPRMLALGALAVYRAILSPVIHAMNGPACRFEPSCSEYARAAVRAHGVIRGGAMAAWRVARCNPIGGHGFDPVAKSGIRQHQGSNSERNLERFSIRSALYLDPHLTSPLQGEELEKREWNS